MRVLFIGAGAVGGWFGGRLAQAGHDVTFLLRPGRAAAVRERGLTLRALDGTEATLRVPVVTASELAEHFDVIVVAVKAYGLEGAMRDLAPAVGPDTVIVPLLNGMRHVEALQERFGVARVWGGVCRVMATLGPAGEVLNVGEVQELSYGPLPGADASRAAEVAEALSGGGFSSTLSDDIVQEMWEKWVMLACLGVMCCLMRGTVGEICRTATGTAATEAALAEIVAVAGACGHAPRPESMAWSRGFLLDEESDATSSMYRDLMSGHPTEGEQIVGDLVARAREHGVATPVVAAAAAQLAIYEHTRTRS